MRRQLFPAIISMIIFIVVLGVVYPLVVTGVAQVAFNHQANGSIVTVNGKKVGSSLIGQSFVDAHGRPIGKYFQSRPSSARGASGTTKNGYDPTLSGASNLGPTNPKQLTLVRERAAAYRKLNGLSAGALVPVDAVTASASGLDPHISIANAWLQARRVARARGLPVGQVLHLVDDHTSQRALGFLGERAVNVLELNLALDKLGRNGS